MRKLMYNCYYKDTKVTTVSTLKEANEWKAKDKFNTIKEELVKFEDRKQESEKERAERLSTITKRQTAIKNKNKK